jgi:hypothetical protein
MMFALELNSRAEILNSSLISTVAEAYDPHPPSNAHHPIRRHVRGIMSRVNHEPGDAPVLPVLYASTSHKAKGGQYYDAHDRSRMRVEPNPNKIPAAAKRPDLRTELWQRTEYILGLHLDVA